MFVGPISEKTTEMKVSIPFTNESISIKLNPSTNKWSVNKVKVHWVTSPTLQIVKKGKDLFAAVKQGSEQEEQVFPCK
jgi:extradiol dioxygenase family protein